MKIATLAIITRGNQVLLGLKQGSPEIGEGTLNGPGGKFESGLGDNTVLGCLFREVIEEFRIFLNLAKTEKVAVITFYIADVPYQEMHVYRTSHFTGEPRETKSMQKPEWYDIDKVPYELMLGADKHFFPQLLRGEKFRTNVYYREKAKGFIRIDPFLPLNDLN